MNDQRPDLRTLFAWAVRADAGQPPQELRDWLADAAGDAQSEAQARDVRTCWAKLVEARRQLSCGETPLDEPTLPADLVARYVDGQTDPQETQRVELTCWQSPADLCDVLSGLTFALPAPPTHRNGHKTQPVAGLEQRLKSLADAGSTVEPVEPIEPTVMPATAEPSEPPIATSTASIRTRRPFGSSRYGRTRARRTWPNWFAPALAALAVVIILLGVFRLVDVLSNRSEAPGQIASPGETPESPPSSPSLPHDAPPHDTPSNNAPSNDASNAPRPNSSRPEKPAPNIADANPRRSEPTQDVKPDRTFPGVVNPMSPVKGPTDGPPARDPANIATAGPVIDKPRDVPSPPIDPRVDNRPSPPARDTTELAVNIDSATGALLVQAHIGGAWRVGSGSQPLSSSLRLVSLEESWSTVEFPGLGSLIFEGDSEVELRRGADQVLEVALRRGRVGLRDLPAQRDVRLVTDDGRWTVRGRGDYSTLGIVRGAESSEVFVAAGIIAVDQIAVAQDQFAPLGDTITPASLASRAPSASPLDNASGKRMDWLRAPDERQRQQWRATNGKLVEQLAAAEDAAAELTKLRAAAKSGRQAALLARWSLAVSETPAREVWSMLSDRDDSVREAGLSYFYEIPFRDRRARMLFAEFSEHVDAAVARRMVEWVMSWQRGQTLFAPRAMELVDALGHEELAVRQVAISVLERHTRPVFEASRRKPPPYEADAPASKRTVAQTQWRLLVRQMYPLK